MKMDKKKKIIIIVISIILILAIILGVIVLKNNKGTKENEKEKSTKTLEITNKISEANQITFTKILDDNNKETIIVKENNAYKESTSKGKTTKYIVKDGNTYYLDDKNMAYYVFENNDMIITEIKEQLQELQEKSANSEKEKIDGKTYNYEEFLGYQGFLINKDIALTNESNSKTRLYYSNDKLKYIKTIVGDKEELLKVNISYNNVNEDYFKIPENYKQNND